MSRESGHGRQSQPSASASFSQDTQPIKRRKRDHLRALLTPQSSESPSPIPPGPITNPQPAPLHGPMIDTSNAPERDDAQRASPNNQPPTLEGNMDSNVRVEALGNRPPTSGLDIHRDNASASTLWINAYNKLSSDDRTNLETLDPKLDQLQVLKGLLDIADKAKQKRTSWTIQWGDKTINVREKAERLMCWIIKFKDIGDIAVQYDPAHAALPWAGVRFILTLVIGEQEQLAAAVVVMERIAHLIGRCAIYEHLYLMAPIPEIARDATTELQSQLLILYITILRVLSRLIKLFRRNILRNITSIVTIPAEIKELDGPDSAVNTAAFVVQSCYYSYTRTKNTEEFDKLQSLLQDFLPAMSEIETTMKRIYKDIKESERIAILKWLSMVPYEGHHDLACKGRVYGTGQWLFQREEFIRWQQSNVSEVLWIHGIPGAGKTKLVSAAIEMLKGVVDKVAFFYCKRDEDDRRNQQKILLSLVKQFACPASGSGIHMAVRDAYTKEHQDPYARRALTTEASLTLLTSLVESYQTPVIVLDALDECPPESQCFILEDFLSLREKSKQTVKILISSRHSLDIEDRLQNLPHVCIEARDNAEDIENYVKTEIALRVRDRRLLRGKVSQDLIEHIQEVLLRDANGMFLWVDYQIRELCKIALERDIRVRLGKLPKDLRGVYDEIMGTIQTQEGSSPQLAERALKWMLVAGKPLEPNELTTAIEIDPAIPLGSTVAPPLGIEVVVHLCGGLILWDNQLDVMRFTHLSVQEYLEDRSRSRGQDSIIDAHLHVAESCLWVLQDPHIVIDSSPSYIYMALTWFWHCRSYQDLVLQNPTSSNRSESPKYKLDIPLLNSFLGSFHHASPSYCKWHDWLNTATHRTDTSRWKPWALCDAVLCPQPVSPIFAVTLSGLAELVKWLWLCADFNGKIKNKKGISLLEVAATNAPSWVVERILAHGYQGEWSGSGSGPIHGKEAQGHLNDAMVAAAFRGHLAIVTLLFDWGADINSVDRRLGTALTAAAAGWHSDIVTVLLDQGADANIIGGNYDTALAAAASKGHSDIVTVLLDRGADVNTSSGSWGTALAAAALRGHSDIVTVLLDRGANVNTISGRSDTPLAAAARGGHSDIVTVLLDRGAAVNTISGSRVTGTGTALAAAAAGGHSDIVTVLLDRGAYVDNIGGGNVTPLAAAAAGGHSDIVTVLLGRGADVNTIDAKYGTALAAAAECGHSDIVTVLVDRGADVNIIGSGYGTALAAAARRGYSDIVTVLLDRGADVNTIGGEYGTGTALAAAASEGHSDIVIVLLDRGADVNTIGGIYGTPLTAAAQGGHLGIATVLLDRGADVNTISGKYSTGTALAAAASKGHSDIVTVLLDRGADVNISSGSCGTALAAAASEGHSDIVTVLLDRGADVNTIGGIKGTALAAAAKGGYSDIFTVLLDRGADVNTIGGEYGTPLAAAAQGGHLDIVTVLLDRGADVNTIGGRNGTALAAAAQGGYSDIVTVLLDRGANVNTTGGVYDTALATAIKYGHSDIVTVLLDRGADVNTSSGSWGTVLAYAASHGHLDIVTVLLDRGADVNTISGSWGTALAAAASGGHLDIVTVLLDRGADVTGSWGTALATAIKYGHSDIVTVLLDRGADVNTSSGSWGTVLAYAASHGHLDIVTVLLDRGADVNTVSGSWGTALAAAASGGHSDIVTVLLNRGADVNTIGGVYGTPLTAAAQGAHSDILTVLLDRGADVNTNSRSWGTALATAASQGHSDIVTVLLDRGAAVNTIGGVYGTALVAATECGHSDIVTVLLDRGADVNTSSGTWVTALAAAARRGYSDIVTVLLDRGADVNTSSGSWGTALAAAASQGHSDIVTVLLNRGADVNTIGGQYGTALAAAAQCGHSDIVTVLLGRGADANIIGSGYGTALAVASQLLSPRLGGESGIPLPERLRGERRSDSCTGDH